MKNSNNKTDAFVNSLKTYFDVIPAKAGIQCFQILLDACLRRHDGISDFFESVKTQIPNKSQNTMTQIPTSFESLEIRVWILFVIW